MPYEREPVRPHLHLTRLDRSVNMIPNGQISQAFDELADLLEIEGANSFRVRAYRNAARTIMDSTTSIAELVQAAPNGLITLPTIGKDLAEKIKVLVQTGLLPQLEEARGRVPAGVRELLRIPGLGPKKVAMLFDELQIETIEQLQIKAEAGEIAKLKGFGVKTEQGILAGIAAVATLGNRWLIAEVKPIADRLVADLSTCPGVTQVTAAGSLRRRKETIGDLDLLCTASDSSTVMDFLATHPLVETVLSRGDTKQRVRLFTGLEMDLRVVPTESYGAALQYFSGSKEHNIVIRRRAQERGLKLNEYGLFREADLVASQTEEEVYRAVDLPWIPPEIRENHGEIEQAERGELPQLVEVADIKGDLHMHTTASDGQATIREMIEAARCRGLQYIAITDHSQRVSMARGLDPARLRAHWAEIREIRKEYEDIQVLCGIECDILENAQMDLPDDVLAEAEWVIGVLHYGLKQSEAEIMARLMTALHNPYVHLIGHPTARLINRRQPVAARMDEVIQAAAEQGKWLEINSSPDRLDLDDLHAAAARRRGIPLVINTDSHSVKGFPTIEWGVYQARRAGCRAADVMNTRPWSEFSRQLAAARKK